jgi:hypothetical protein
MMSGSQPLPGAQILRAVSGTPTFVKGVFGQSNHAPHHNISNDNRDRISSAPKQACAKPTPHPPSLAQCPDVGIWQSVRRALWSHQTSSSLVLSSAGATGTVQSRGVVMRVRTVFGGPSRRTELKRLSTTVVSAAPVLRTSVCAFQIS